MDEIDVWEVEPHTNTDFNVAIFDDHARAIAYIGELAESIIDELGEHDEMTITIRHKTMTRREFEECCGGE